MIHDVNKLINNYHYKKVFFKIKNTKHIKQLIPVLLKINVIKYAFLKDCTWLIYLPTNQLVRIVKFSKPTESHHININELKKLTKTKNCLFIMSTNKGIMTNIQAINKNTGGFILFGVTY